MHRFTVAGQKRAFYADPPSPCFDSCNPLSRQWQVFKPTDTCVCRDRRKCLSCQGQVSDGAWQTPDNQYALTLKHKPPGEVVDQLLIPTQVKLYRVHVNVRHISAMSICNFYQNFIIFATGLGQLIPRCIR